MFSPRIRNTVTLVFNVVGLHLTALTSGLPERNTTRPRILNIFTPALARGHNYNPTAKTHLVSAAG